MTSPGAFNAQHPKNVKATVWSIEGQWTHPEKQK
jgi:hypothetical protein